MSYQRLFSIQEDVLKTIAGQKRLEIIQLLKDRELSVGEMVNMLGIRQANLSQHLAILRQHNVVTARKQGLNVHYSLTDSRIAQACELIREFLKDQHREDTEIANIIAKSEMQLYPVVQDSVCGMRVSVSDAAAFTDGEGRTHYFCADGCLIKFKADPAQYAMKVALT